MRLAPPSTEHGLLERLTGNWEGEEVILPSPSAPEGGRALGRVRNRLSLGGFVLLHEYRHERDGWEDFTGHGIITWSRADGCYVMHWFDSSGSAPVFFNGTFRDGVMVLEALSAQTRIRLTWEFLEDSRYESRVETSTGGGYWQPCAEATYFRREPRNRAAGIPEQMDRLGIVANVLGRLPGALQ
jgi:hypothetical protein